MVANGEISLAKCKMECVPGSEKEFIQLEPETQKATPDRYYVYLSPHEALLALMALPPEMIADALNTLKVKLEDSQQAHLAHENLLHHHAIALIKALFATKL